METKDILDQQPYDEQETENAAREGIVGAMINVFNDIAAAVAEGRITEEKSHQLIADACRLRDEGIRQHTNHCKEHCIPAPLARGLYESDSLPDSFWKQVRSLHYEVIEPLDEVGQWVYEQMYTKQGINNADNKQTMKPYPPQRHAGRWCPADVQTWHDY